MCPVVLTRGADQMPVRTASQPSLLPLPKSDGTVGVLCSVQALAIFLLLV